MGKKAIVACPNQRRGSPCEFAAKNGLRKETFAMTAAVSDPVTECARKLAKNRR
jgi:hypothetical protein